MIAKISKRIPVAKDTILVEFKLPKKVAYQPGQSFEVKLIDPPYRDWEGTSRFFSIANPAGRKDYVTTITRMRSSAFKRSLAKMPLGSKVEVGSIDGTFLLPKAKKASLVFIAGGVGITPFLSMIEYARRKPGWRVIFLYANKNHKTAVHFRELQAMADTNENVKVVFTMTDDKTWQGDRGRINRTFLARHLKNPKSHLYYLAGSPRMNYDITEALLRLGVPAKRIKAEDFDRY